VPPPPTPKLGKIYIPLTNQIRVRAYIIGFGPGLGLKPRPVYNSVYEGVYIRKQCNVQLSMQLSCNIRLQTWWLN